MGVDACSILIVPKIPNFYDRKCINASTERFIILSFQEGNFCIENLLSTVLQHLLWLGGGGGGGGHLKLTPFAYIMSTCMFVCGAVEEMT